MALLLIGLLLFLGIHSLRIVGERPREAMIGRLGENGYKGLYALISLAGIVMASMGFSRAQASSFILYLPPDGLRHLALVLVPIALSMVAAAYAPAGRIKAFLRHPMVAGVALWALAHLLANGSVVTTLFFGAFLVWALADYAAALRRAPRPVPALGWTQGDAIALAVAAVASAVLIGGLHRWLFGVSPLA